MHERTNLDEIAVFAEVFGNQVLDRLDVMIRRAFYCFDPARLLGTKVLGEVVQVLTDDR